MSHSDPIDGAGARAGRRAHEAVVAPSAWVERWLAGLPAAARVLDLATGSGRHARLAHASGARVLAADRDGEALAALRRELPAIDTLELDLEAGRWQLAPASFDAVVVTNYLFRPRFALLCALLAPGGRLVYETFARGNEAFGKPSNPDFLLREGELLERARLAGLVVLAYESGRTAQPKPALVQRICAVRPPVDRERLVLGGGIGGGDGAPG